MNPNMEENKGNPENGSNETNNANLDQTALTEVLIH